MSTGLATLASPGRISAQRVAASPAPAPAARARPPRRRRRRGSRARRRSSARRRGGRAAAAGSRAAPATSTSSSSVRARSTPAWWKSASTAASEPASAAVCELAALAPAAVAPALQGEDRLAPRHAAREPRELARVAERLEVEQDEHRSPGRPPTTRAGRSRRRPPCCRSRRTPRSRGALEPCSSSASPSAPHCDEKPMRPGGQRAAARRSRSGAASRRRSRGSSARAAGAPCARTSASSCSCRSTTLGADLREAGRDHAERRHALAPAPPRPPRARAGRAGR